MPGGIGVALPPILFPDIVVIREVDNGREVDMFLAIEEIGVSSTNDLPLRRRPEYAMNGRENLSGEYS